MHEWKKALRRAAGGFSMVELLMVVAVIAVITALLVPAIRTAKERTKRTRCMNNLRQIGQGLMLYASDRGSFPHSSHYEWWSDWAEAIVPYMVSGRYVLLTGPPNGATGIWQEVTTGAWVDHDYSQNRWNFFTCPSGPVASAGATFKYPHNYSCNEWLMPVNYKDYYVGSMPIRPTKPAALLRPGSLILILDSGIMDPTLAWGKGDAPDTSWYFKVAIENDFVIDGPAVASTRGYWAATTPAGNDNDSGPGDGYPVYYRHAGWCNAVMADGHVQTFKNGDIQRRNWVSKGVCKQWIASPSYVEVYYP
jgi:prepilin-type processing-associated H-X9-DG protein/prepilin-type N-terminal cleavage/methylation domain-containing protein